MPQDLPGFYYDAEKNRYFPIKSPIPGSSSRNTSTASTSAQKPPPKTNNKAKYGAKVVKMLHKRELCGNSIISNKKKVNFQDQYQKIQTSKPIIWKYEGTQRIGDAALEHVCLNVQTPNGLIETEILLTGGLNGTFCCYEVGYEGQHAINGLQCMPDVVHPLNIEKEIVSLKSPGVIWRPIGALVQMPSNVSCIKIPRNYSFQENDVDSSPSHALITSLGSETSGGSLYLMNIKEPLEHGLGVAMLSQRIEEISRFKSTVWSTDYNPNKNQAVIGTNIGAALVHIESGKMTWICRSKSDILSLQFDSSGNNVLCGLRNGCIVTIDTRQKPQDLENYKLRRHQISFSSSGKGQKREKRLFEIRGNVHHSRTIFMPSSVSCLVGLKMYDDYFLASSMDGTIRLYDHRLIKRGPVVQFYEGHVNSHTRVQIGVDPSEKYFMSGGEDCYVRVWSIKSGEILFENKFMDSVATSVCWPKRCRNEFGGAWLGSQEGLFYVNNNTS